MFIDGGRVERGSDSAVRAACTSAAPGSAVKNPDQLRFRRRREHASSSAADGDNL